MHHYCCPQCGFRVLSDQQAEAVAVAQRHHERRHDAKDMDEIAAALTQVDVAGDAADADDDDPGDLGPVFSGGSADEW